MLCSVYVYTVSSTLFHFIGHNLTQAAHSCSC